MAAFTVAIGVVVQLQSVVITVAATATVATAAPVIATADDTVGNAAAVAFWTVVAVAVVALAVWQ